MDLKGNLTELECKETICRTAIACDEQNNFSSIVRLRIFDRYGEWAVRDGHAYEFRKVCHNCGTHCPFCSDKEDVVPIWRKTLELHGSRIRTPFCSDEELGQGGCQVARDVSEVLVQRHEFYKTEGQLLNRIQKMSHSIRYRCME